MEEKVHKNINIFSLGIHPSIPFPGYSWPFQLLALTLIPSQITVKIIS
jgi:hypothetical protein